MWQQELLWVNRNDQGVIIGVSDKPPEIDFSEKRWNAAIENARFFEKEYAKIPTGIFALSMTIRPAIERYERGERSDELLELLEQIQ